MSKSAYASAFLQRRLCNKSVTRGGDFAVETRGAPQNRRCGIPYCRFPLLPFAPPTRRPSRDALCPGPRQELGKAQSGHPKSSRRTNRKVPRPSPLILRPLGALPPGVELPPVDPNAPTLFTAVQEQLGLKLESTKGPVDVQVIDSVDRPTPD